MTTPTVRRARLLTGAALAVTAAGVVLAVVQPPWLTEPLRDAVLGAGAAGPVVFVLLCVLAAPVHLTGLLTALSVVVWPLPVAAPSPTRAACWAASSPPSCSSARAPTAPGGSTGGRDGWRG